MKKIAVIYWSNGGNVEILAESIAKGAREAGAEVSIKMVQDAKVQDIIEADAIALGSPSLDNNKIEQDYMAPFVKELKLLPSHNKALVLFGSYGWDEGKFLENWSELMIDYGFNIVGKLAVKEAPTENEVEEAKSLGKTLAK
ncbi:flavodoxin [Clostridium bovifaecis]|uniref:Flavodoxin n=1 Tax=Clostridium bovifaecis TaxID=2184719 RepID=A0A6I6FBY8_9CLOT|nr:flavodoxin [Clostridium bovifaecis]